MGRSRWYTLAFMLLALAAYVQSAERNRVVFEIVDQPDEKGTSENEDSFDETVDEDDIPDSSDADDSLEDDDYEITLSSKQLLSNPVFQEIQSLLQESLKKVSDLDEMDPWGRHKKRRKKKKKKRSKRHHKKSKKRRKKRHHSKHKHQQHKHHQHKHHEHEHHEHEHHEHNHPECTSSGDNEYSCSNTVAGQEVSATVVYDESTSEYQVTVMVNEQEEVQGSGAIGSPICGQNSYCVEIQESGEEKCVQLTSPEAETIGCFTGE